MSQFENSEVMLGYAKIMEGSLVKQAWSWRDIATELGIEAAVTGVVAGAGALGIGTGGATGLAGAGAALTIGGLPVVAVIAGGVALTMGIWYLTRQMDDNIPDLIDRLEDLDPNENYAAVVQGWIAKLNYFRPLLAAAPTTTDPMERANLNMRRKAAVDELVAYMDQMWIDWATVKNNLDDMVFDAGQAEDALEQTLTAIKTIQTNLKATMAQAAEKDKAEILSKLKESSGTDYTQIATAIIALYAQTIKLTGKEPRFDTSDEKSAWAFAQNIAGPKEKRKRVSAQDAQIAGPLMQQLKLLMEQGVKELQAKTPAPEAKAASTKPLLSKRAYSISTDEGYQAVIPEGGTAAKTRGRGKGRRKGKGSPVVRGLQIVVNKINKVLHGGAGIIDEDGIYGKYTGDALSGVLSSDWRIANVVAKHAKVNKHTVKDIELMRRRPELIKAVYRVLSPIAQNMVVDPGQGIAGKTDPRQYGRQISQRDQGPREMPGPSGGRCNPGKENPRSGDILDCLKSYFKIEDPETRQKLYAYDWVKGMVDAEGRRLISDDKMINVIRDQFPTDRFTASDWSKPQFVTAIQMLPEYKRKQKARRQEKAKVPQRLSIPSDREKMLHYMKNYFKITAVGEEWDVYEWLKMLGADETLMYQWMNSFIDEKQGGSRVWDSKSTPDAFFGWVKLNRMGGREGGTRIM